MSSMWQQAGRRLIRLDRELEGRRGGEREHKRGEKVMVGALWSTQAQQYTNTHTGVRASHSLPCKPPHAWAGFRLATDVF